MHPSLPAMSALSTGGPFFCKEVVLRFRGMAMVSAAAGLRVEGFMPHEHKDQDLTFWFQGPVSFHLIMCFY